MPSLTPPLSDVGRAVLEATRRRDTLFPDGEPPGEGAPAGGAAVLLVELLDRSFDDVTVHASPPSGRGTTSATQPSADAERTYWFELSTDVAAPRFILERRSDGAASGVESRWVVSDTPPAAVTAERSWPATSVLAGRCDDDRLVLWTAILRTRRWGEALFVDDRADSLVNNCFDLAGKLLAHLGPMWGGPRTAVAGRTTCHVMRGGLRTDGFDPLGPTTIRAAEGSGQVHFWVEAVNDDAGATYICDPWGRSVTAFGAPFLRTEYPDNYVPAVDGVITFPEMDGDRHWADPLE